MNARETGFLAKKAKRVNRAKTGAAAGIKPAGLVLINNRIKIVAKKISKVKDASIVAFISGRIGSTFVTNVVRGTEERINGFAKGTYELHHYPSGSRKNGAGESVREIVKGKRADAIIILSMMPDKADLELLKKSGIPAVFIERRVRGLHSVTVDNFKGGYDAARQLISSGRKKLGVILDPQVNDRAGASSVRFQGFLAALKEAGLKLNDRHITSVKVHNIENGRDSFDKIARAVRHINGLFSVAGDLTAIGFIIEAKSHGIRIPADLAVIGYDDVEMASAVEPQLTTVRQPIGRMGGMAVEIVHEALHGRLKSPKNMVLDSELIIRETT